MTLASAVPLVRETAQELEFANGSRIASLPGADDARIRGFSDVDLLVIDEASRVSDQLYQAVRPMLAVSGGRIVLLSTPWGKRGFFFEEWENGGDAWHRTKVTADQCPRISAEFLEQERRQIGEWWFAQEYQCEFVDTTDQVFRSEDIQAMFSPEVQPLWQ